MTYMTQSNYTIVKMPTNAVGYKSEHVASISSNETLKAVQPQTDYIYFMYEEHLHIYEHKLGTTCPFS